MNVGFKDAWDYLIESRTVGQGQEPLRSAYLHIMEGFRDGEQSVIKEVVRLPVSEGPLVSDEALALKLTFSGGHTDTVLCQPHSRLLSTPDGLSTDARYALLRRDARGEVMEADLVRGTVLRCGRFSAQVAGDLKGTLVDIIGDLTGTRTESALLIRPEGTWPTGSGLAGRPISIEVLTHHLEAYTIEKVTALPEGLLRVDLANHAPFSMGWYQVNALDAKKLNRLYSNRQLWAGINTPWWWGCKAWFPERGQTFTIEHTSSEKAMPSMVIPARKATMPRKRPAT